MTKNIKTRFAPSPTGAPHVGNIRTALFAWLFARHNNGKFVLRVEDTDQSRVEEGSLDSILKSLAWLGMDIDEGVIESEKETGEFGPYFQSKRLDIYKEHAQKLVGAGKAYHCFCSQARLSVLKEVQKSKKQPPHYDGRCKLLEKKDVDAKLKEENPFVIRMDIPEKGETSFEDAIKGTVTIQNSTIDDQVILKSDGFPTYHLASVVDDHLMEISHVIRADEWIASTPKHVLLYQSFGWEEPVWVHLPIILGQDKSKLSKRHGDVSVLDYQKQGYLADALVNYLSFLGWNPKTEQEVMTRDELIKQFDLAKINKNNPIFDLTKLNWMNKQYIKTMPEDKLAKLIGKGASEKGVRLVKDRMEKISDYQALTGFLQKITEYKPEILIAKGLDQAKTKEMLQASFDIAEKVSNEEWSEEALRETYMEFTEEHDIKKGDLLWPLRVSVTGLEKSPDVFGSMDVLGKEESLERIEKGIEKL